MRASWQSTNVPHPHSARRSFASLVVRIRPPGATFFQILSTVTEKLHEPLFTTIDFEVDVDGRHARLNVPGMIEARGEPILNPVTGSPTRARIDLPNGFEYSIAEVGRGWAKSTGAVPFTLDDSHAHFAKLHMTQDGVVH